MARLNAGRDRVAKEKRERDASAADSTNLLRRESEHSRIVGAEKNIGTHEPVGDMAGQPASSVRLLSLARKTSSPAVYLTRFSRAPASPPGDVGHLNIHQLHQETPESIGAFFCRIAGPKRLIYQP
jgi:hypothetical protein